MDKDYRSDYEVRKATLKAMGGDETKDYRSVYEIDLEILKLTEEGGGGMDEGKVREIVEGYEYKNEAGVKQIIEDENLQPKLVSGENIKTVNGEDILGEGDIKIEAGEKNWYGTEEEFNELGEYDYETSYHIDGDISYNELADRPTFKTINGEQIIGSGDIEIKGGGNEAIIFDLETISYDGKTINGNLTIADVIEILEKKDRPMYLKYEITLYTINYIQGQGDSYRVYGSYADAYNTIFSVQFDVNTYGMIYKRTQNPIKSLTTSDPFTYYEILYYDTVIYTAADSHFEFVGAPYTQEEYKIIINTGDILMKDRLSEAGNYIFNVVGNIVNKYKQLEFEFEDGTTETIEFLVKNN